MEKDSILALLPSLSKDYLRALQAVIGGLLGQPVDQLAITPHPVMFDALVTALGLAMGFQNLPVAAQKAFKTKAVNLDNYLTHWIPSSSSLTKTGQKAFYYDLFALLKNDLLSREVKPSISVMINNMGRMPYVIDQAYPCYLASGMSYLITRGYIHERHIKENK